MPAEFNVHFLLNKYQCCIAVLRDTQERGRDLEQVLATYANFVKPAFEEFCLPVSLFFLHKESGIQYTYNVIGFT